MYFLGGRRGGDSKKTGGEFILIKVDSRDLLSLFGESTSIRCAVEAGSVHVNIITVHCSACVCVRERHVLSAHPFYALHLAVCFCSPSDTLSSHMND